jgi:hypothetical protein
MSYVWWCGSLTTLAKRPAYNGLKMVASPGYMAYGSFPDRRSVMPTYYAS